MSSIVNVALRRSSRSLGSMIIFNRTYSHLSNVIARPSSLIPSQKVLSYQAREFKILANIQLRKHRLLGLDETKQPEDAVNNILYNTQTTVEKWKRHILQALVTDEPGVLSKVSGLLAARGFNIDSLVVSATEVPKLSRMTIVLKGTDAHIEQAKKQLEDIIPVWAVLDFTKTEIIERELLLIKVSVKPEDVVITTDEPPQFTASNAVDAHLKRQAVTELTSLFGGKIIDVSLTHCTVELCAESSRIDGFIHMLKPFGIIEAARSGVMVVSKMPFEGTRDTGEDEKAPTEAQAPTVDETQLPPG